MVYLGRNKDVYNATVDEGGAADEFRWTKYKRALVARHLSALPSRGKVADIGCRDGINAAFFKVACGVDEMHGVEIADAPLVQARARGILTARWVSGETPFPAEDGTFDAVVAMDVIEHIYDTEEFVRELARVTRDDGTLLITIPNLAWWRNRLRLLVGKMPAGAPGVAVDVLLDRAIDLKHLRMGVASEWINLFETAGLSVEAKAGYSYDILSGVQRSVDLWLTRWPTLSHSILYVLRKSKPAGPTPGSL